MTLRVGIAGLGGAARQVLPSFEHMPGVELTAVADVRPKALEDFASLGVKTFASADAMCDSSDVDAVWTSTPNDLHMEHVSRAANNGKHVICEKPMALNLEVIMAILKSSRTGQEVRPSCQVPYKDSAN